MPVRAAGSRNYAEVYSLLVAPAVEKAGLEPVGIDKFAIGVSPSEQIRAAISDSDVMIADISEPTSNVFFEIGMRMGTRPRSLILIRANRDKLDYGFLSEQRVFLYPDSPTQLRAEALQLISALTDWIVNFALPAEWSKEDYFDRLREYHRIAAWDEVVRFAGKVPAEIRRDPVFVRLLAQALDKRNQPGDRNHALRVLNEVAGAAPNAETLALLGRIHSSQFFESHELKDLDLAIDAYRRSYQTDDTYVHAGLRLAGLLHLRPGDAAFLELSRILPALRTAADRQLRSSPSDYWAASAALELAFLAGDWNEAERLSNIVLTASPRSGHSKQRLIALS
jgi:hypothetical protein